MNLAAFIRRFLIERLSTAGQEYPAHTYRPRGPLNLERAVRAAKTSTPYVAVQPCRGAIVTGAGGLRVMPGPPAAGRDLSRREATRTWQGWIAGGNHSV